jgi:uncharacterized surface anchored protein
MKNIVVYAAPVSSQGAERLASVDPLVDARTTTDAQGKFEIRNLKPGEYALATQSPLGIILPHDQTGKVITFQVAAGRETALGAYRVGYVYPDGD